jgi:GPI ethanolamine phosphate transferase 1
LSHLYRRDVEQADIATIMSSLIGTDWPVHSLGVLPDIDHSRPGYIDFPAGAKSYAEAALVNAKVSFFFFFTIDNIVPEIALQVVFEHYSLKDGTSILNSSYETTVFSYLLVAKKKSELLSYKPFPASPPQYLPNSGSSVVFPAIEKMINQARYDEARTASTDVVKYALAGIRYLNT